MLGLSARGPRSIPSQGILSMSEIIGHCGGDEKRKRKYKKSFQNNTRKAELTALHTEEF